MFRFVNYKDNHVLTNVEIKVSLALMLEENGKPTFKFYDLALERTKVDILPMNWTVVHAIDENSPMRGFTEKDFENADMEVYVLVTGFDDIFASPVLRRTSYTWRELKFNKRFVPIVPGKRRRPDNHTGGSQTKQHCRSEGAGNEPELEDLGRKFFVRRYPYQNLLSLHHIILQQNLIIWLKVAGEDFYKAVIETGNIKLIIARW